MGGGRSLKTEPYRERSGERWALPPITGIKGSPRQFVCGVEFYFRLCKQATKRSRA